METLYGYTIDAPHSRDLDDAIFVERDTNGWDVLVLIADVAASVPRGSTDDERAKARVVTQYAATTAKYPMLKNQLTMALSLTPGTSKPCVAMRIQLDRALNVVSYEAQRTDFVSLARLNYDDIPAMIGRRGEVSANMTLAYDLARSLFQKRMGAGGFVAFDPDRLWSTMLTDATPESLHAAGYAIVSESMILANYASALRLRELGAGVFRNHDRFREEDHPDLARALEAMRAGDYQPMAELKIEIGHLAEKAYYSERCSGHFGLGLEAYAHVTSPLRRYADLENQRALVGDPMESAAYRDLSSYLNARMAVIMAQRDAAARLYVDKVVAEAIASGNIGAFTDGDFTRIIKRVAEREQAAPDGFEAEVLSRLKERRLKDVDLACLCAAKPEAVSHDVRQAVAIAVLEHPESAASIWGILNTRFGYARPTVEEAKTASVGFEVTGRRDGVAVTGSSSTKRGAEHRALALLLAITLGLTESEALEVEFSKSVGFGSAKGLLIAACRDRGLGMPFFTTVNVGQSNTRPQYQAAVSVVLANGEQVESGEHTALSASNAEAAAAQAILERVRSSPKHHAAEDIGNAFGALNERAQKAGLALPTVAFSDLGDGRFRCVVNLTEPALSGEGEGLGKMPAKQRAARALLDTWTEHKGPRAIGRSQGHG